MKKIYLMSPDKVPLNPVLFPTILPTFQKNGFVINKQIFFSDIVMLDLHTRISDYKEIDVEWLLQNKVPVVIFDEYDRGGLSNEIYPEPLTLQQKKIFQHIEENNIPVIHFCRLLDKTQKYSLLHYPYEKPILYEEPPVSAEELFSRPYDVCLIANTSPQREAIAAALRSDKRLKCIIKLGEPKLPFDEFLALHKKGKFFISSAAGGYTDERVQCLFSIAAIIRQRTDQWVANDFTHLENCLRIDSPPTEQDLNDLYEICNNKEKLYQIYLDGVTFVKQYWSAEAMGKRYLEILTKEGIL